MEEILRNMIGDLFVQIAILRAQNQQLTGALGAMHRDNQQPPADQPNQPDQAYPANGAGAAAEF